MAEQGYGQFPNQGRFTRRSNDPNYTRRLRLPKGTGAEGTLEDTLAATLADDYFWNVPTAPPAPSVVLAPSWPRRPSAPRTFQRSRFTVAFAVTPAAPAVQFSPAWPRRPQVPVQPRRARPALPVIQPIARVAPARPAPRLVPRPRPVRAPSPTPVAPVAFAPATLARPHAFSAPGRLRVPVRFAPSESGGTPPTPAGDFGTIILILDTPRIELAWEIQ